MPQLSARSDIHVDLVDLIDFDLPTSLEITEDATKFAQRIATADAYLFIVPEYNHGYPASLKAALDATYTEWHAKPAAFVSYGGISGGIRAVEQLRQVLAELHVATIRESVHIPHAREKFDIDGNPVDERLNKALDKMTDQLVWWATALRNERIQTPYAS